MRLLYQVNACGAFLLLCLLGESLAQSTITSNTTTTTTTTTPADCSSPSSTRLTNTKLPLALQSYLEGGLARLSIVEEHGSIQEWDTSCVTDLSQLFRWTTAFSEDLSQWNVARVTRMDGLLEMSTQFRGTLAGWDTSRVVSMTRIGHRSSGLNATRVGMSGWNTSRVVDLGHAFDASIGFSGDLRGWNTQRVTTLERLFVDSTAFQADLSGWNLEQVQIMDYAFAQSHQFRGQISDWKLQTVQSMPFLFADAVDFGPLDRAGSPLETFDWDTSQVTDLSFALQGTTHFNTDLVASWTTPRLSEMRLAFAKSKHLHGTQPGQWTTTNVNNMMSLFASSTNFTSPLITNFDTSSVYDMNAMFKYSHDFRGDISHWNTGSVRNMEEFALESSAFGGDVSQWNVSRVTSLKDAFGGAQNMPAQPLVLWNTERVRNMYRIFDRTDWGFVNDNTVEDWPVRLCWNVESVAYTYLDAFTCTTTPDIGLDCACLKDDDVLDIVNGDCSDTRPPCLGSVDEDDGATDSVDTPESSIENIVETASAGIASPFSTSRSRDCTFCRLLGFAATVIMASCVLS